LRHDLAIFDRYMAEHRRHYSRWVEHDLPAHHLRNRWADRHSHKDVPRLIGARVHFGSSASTIPPAQVLAVEPGGAQKSGQARLTRTFPPFDYNNRQHPILPIMSAQAGAGR